jgi:uncharacterized membrane protein YraQ (UPF0718 family)
MIMFLDDVNQIVTFVLDNFLKMWPYLLLSIPLAVLVRVTNASQYIRRAFTSRPLVSLVLATLVGAFSPFCSCGVIPIITSLLIAGVPLGPVMAFWIASPTMDPEIFLLSVGTLGIDLASVRMVATLLVSFGAGLITHMLEQRGFFKDGILREQKQSVDWSFKRLVASVTRRFRSTSALTQPIVQPAPAGVFVALNTIPVASALGGSAVVQTDTVQPASCGCGSQVTEQSLVAPNNSTCGCDSAQPVSRNTVVLELPTWGLIRKETIDATVMVVKFMLIAFLLEAIITLYVPQETIVTWVGKGNPFSILFAAVVGVPIYTSNLAALPLVSGLLSQGMLPGAALAFLISGPATTIPAMSAVYGITKPRVFALYIGTILIGAVVLGYGYQLLLSLTAL